MLHKYFNFFSQTVPGEKPKVQGGYRRPNDKDIFSIREGYVSIIGFTAFYFFLSYVKA